MIKIRFFVMVGCLIASIISYSAVIAANTSTEDKASLAKTSSVQKPLKENYQPLSSENKKYWINATQYLIYSFSLKPQLGTTIF